MKNILSRCTENTKIHYRAFISSLRIIDVLFCIQLISWMALNRLNWIKLSFFNLVYRLFESLLAVYRILVIGWLRINISGQTDDKYPNLLWKTSSKHVFSQLFSHIIVTLENILWFLYLLQRNVIHKYYTKPSAGRFNYGILFPISIPLSKWWNVCLVCTEKEFIYCRKIVSWIWKNKSLVMINKF